MIPRSSSRSQRRAAALDQINAANGAARGRSVIVQLRRMTSAGPTDRQMTVSSLAAPYVLQFLLKIRGAAALDVEAPRYCAVPRRTGRGCPRHEPRSSSLPPPGCAGQAPGPRDRVADDQYYRDHVLRHGITAHTVGPDWLRTASRDAQSGAGAGSVKCTGRLNAARAAVLGQPRRGRHAVTQYIGWYNGARLFRLRAG